MGVGGGRRPVRRAAASWGAFVVVAGILAVTCGCSVDGTAHPGIGTHLVSSSAFPRGSAPTVVEGAGLVAVLADVAGVAAGDTVVPADCAPAPASADPSDSAALVALQPSGAVLPGTLTVVATRVHSELRDVEAAVARCSSYVVTNAAGASSTVREAAIVPTPAVPVADVATFGIARTRTTGGSGPGGTGEGALGVSAKTYVAQRGDVRIYVVYRGTATAAAAGADPARVAAQSTTELDALFAAAVAAAFG